MRVRYDKKADAMYIRFSEEKYFESDEVEEGIIIDYDKSRKIIGLEILDASDHLSKKAIKNMKEEYAKAKA